MPLPIHVQPLNIAADLPITQLFSHFASEPWAMLLDSANSQHSNGRFDLFVARPLCTLTSTGEQTIIDWGEQRPSQTRSENPLKLLREAHSELWPNRPTIPEDYKNLPFVSGAVGHFGYDLGRRFEQLPVQAQVPHANPDMAVGLYSWCVLHDNHKGNWLLVTDPRFATPSPVELEAMATSSSAIAPFKLTSRWQANLSEADYHQRLAKIHDYLVAGDCYQVNFAQRFVAEYQGDEWLAYLALREANQAPFSAFIRLPKSVILSISPERFIQVHGEQVETKPIKGTRPRHLEPEQDAAEAEMLQNSEKDRAENLMIVDLLRNDLSKHCVAGSVKVPEIFALESFPAVHHLVSRVVGQLKLGSDPLDLLQGAFPGGSITGAPKIRAMQIIEELEPHRRNSYCGSIGYLSAHGHMDTSICIRTLLCENGLIYCWAGGGIVLDSNAATEYQESLHKVAKILPVLANLTDD